MELSEKLAILAAGAKYDVACTSSGANRPGTLMAGCCHSFAADGRCISLLKVLQSNDCIYDCKYCVNRSANDIPRATFTPEELAELTIQFYRRNYIEGLFLSSAVIGTPDQTVETMIRTLRILRHERNFTGYIHAKAIPGAAPELIYALGLLADRISVNIELPSEDSLRLYAPNKTRASVLAPMGRISAHVQESNRAMTLYRHAPRFASAGQSTQMIIGLSPESDRQILCLSEALYQKYALRRVFYSAYMPIVEDSLLPALHTPPPLLREHRLYQADWLLRYYSFEASEILTEEAPNFNPFLDPKCNWALHHMQYFPVDVNRADRHMLLRVPGFGPKSVQRILTARRQGRLDTTALARMGAVMKRARYFILATDMPRGMRFTREQITRSLIDPGIYKHGVQQLSLFEDAKTLAEAPGMRIAADEAARGLAKLL